ncbi:MAG: undecaprenyldiphospho-muramoylpentapeptide beta-N-acetylglucosaminyltransferase [Clostridiales bacterium]|nr:undecaprenyldiphospho-muramoylpentapeptide beta-N-acetylglucosaminyltransferase [Clostridiales bacterium]MBR6986995.1 undecaprenyldiphospho-muramoylpentapeptide beta-N-acetylglucosaminyltransferase [Clostridiales bacterium]
MERRYMITGGGTSGHINPALAIAGLLQEDAAASGDTCKIKFTGRKTGLEGELVPKAGYEFIDVEALPMPSKPSPQIIKALRAMQRGKKQCLELIKEFKPDCVISTGGYVSGPLLSAARKAGVPIMIHEANAFPGRANKYLSKGAALVMTGFPGQEKIFSKAKKVVYTGNPVRDMMFGRTKEGSRKELGIDPDRKMVFIMGGSLGSATLTNFVFDIAKKPEYKDVCFFISVGKHNSVEITPEIKAIPNLEIKEYIDRPDLYMSSADCSILRAGAVTCAEITATGACAIMVPYPYAAHDHQTYNANSLASKGAGIVVSDDDVKAGKLESVLIGLINDPARQESIRKAALSLAVKDTGKRITDAIKSAL